jgi:hypothetical protein
MSTCVNCLSYTSTNCIKTEETFSFEYSDFNDLLLKLDQKSEELKKVLSADIDKKWIKEDHEYVTQYIQDIINKLDVLSKETKAAEPKFLIPSSITGTGEKTLLQLLTILVKHVESLENKLATNTSSLYLPNV